MAGKRVQRTPSTPFGWTTSARPLRFEQLELKASPAVVWSVSDSESAPKSDGQEEAAQVEQTSALQILQFVYGMEPIRIVRPLPSTIEANMADRLLAMEAPPSLT